LIFHCRLRVRPLLFIAVCSALVFHRANAAAQEAIEDFPPQGNYKIIGTVVNSITGEPVRRALVTDGLHAALTDMEGKFEFDGLPKGSTTVNVTKPGFLNEQERHLRLNHSYQPRSVEIGPDSAPITLKLIPEGIVYGRVESNGEPVPNLPVKLMAQEVIEGRRQWVVPGQTTTNDDGEFRISGLPAGAYYVSAGPSWTQETGVPQTSRQFELGYAETFYPQAGELSGAAPIRISAGDHTEADFSLKTTRLFKISGTIVGAPVQGTNLQFLNSVGEVAQFPVHYEPATGGFETMAPGGAYLLKAENYPVNTQQMMTSVPLNISADITGLQLNLAPTASIPVEVQKEAVAPDAGNVTRSTTVTTLNGRSIQVGANDGSSVQVRLRDGSSLAENHQYFSNFRMAAGRPIQEIQNVEPGRYSAEISAGGRWYVVSAQCGSLDLLHDELTIGVGVQPPPISVVIRNDPAQINGTVSSDGKPAEGTVLIIPEGRPLGTKAISVSRGGDYFMPVLAPGDYAVLALDHAEDLEYTNPDALRPYLSKAQHVVLQPNQKEELNLEIVKGEPE